MHSIFKVFIASKTKKSRDRFSKEKLNQNISARNVCHPITKIKLYIHHQQRKEKTLDVIRAGAESARPVISFFIKHISFIITN